MTPHPGQLHPAQRFDRDAVMTMAKEAVCAAISPECAEVWRAGCAALGIEDFEILDDDILTDRLLEWFGGKGAA